MAFHGNFGQLPKSSVRWIQQSFGRIGFLRSKRFFVNL